MRKYREDSHMFYLLRLYATKSNHNPKQIQEPKDVAEPGRQKVADSGKSLRQWLLYYATATLHTVHCFTHDVPALSFTPFIQK